MNWLKNYLLDILRLTSIITLSILMLFSVVYWASIWPTSSPTGEKTGWNFINYFNNIKWDCPNGEVLIGFNMDLTKKCWNP